MAQTNRQKIESILLAIESQMEKVRETKDLKSNSTVQQFEGKLGADVTFTVECWGSNKTSLASQRAFVELKSKDQSLCKITTEHGFVQMTEPYFFQGKYWEGHKEVNPNTDITVVSPKWQAGTGLVTVTKDTQAEHATQKLSIYHAANEPADNVIRNLSAAIASSEQQAAFQAKLSKFNLLKSQNKSFGRGIQL